MHWTLAELLDVPVEVYEVLVDDLNTQTPG
jgi:hypothetical protein